MPNKLSKREKKKRRIRRAMKLQRFREEIAQCLLDEEKSGLPKLVRRGMKLFELDQAEIARTVGCRPQWVGALMDRFTAQAVPAYIQFRVLMLISEKSYR